MAYGAGLWTVQIAQAVEVKGKLTQGAKDVRSAMAAHQVGVFAPEFVALPMTAIFDVPVPAHKFTVSLDLGVAGAEAAYVVAYCGLCVGFVEVLSAHSDEAAGKGDAGFFGVCWQHPYASAFEASVVVFYLASVKRGRGAPGCLAAKLCRACLRSLGWLSLTARR